MATLSFDVAAFRASFPAYSNATTYPDATLLAYWDVAILYINNSESCVLSGATLARCLNLMTAHLVFLADLVAKGQVPGVMSQAQIDKISITLHTMPIRSMWQWWLSLSPYGQQLLALLQAQAVGGFQIGGLPETMGFRKVYGLF